MVTKRKVSGTTSGIPTGILYGVLLSIAITFAGIAILAYLVSEEMMAQENIGACAVITIMVSAAAGAILTAAKVKRMRVQMCLASSAGYFVVLLAITAVFFGGQYSGVGITGATMLVGIVCAVLISAVVEKRGKHSVRKKGYR